MKPWLFLLSAAGLVLAIALIVWNGAAQVGTDFLAAGWGVALVVLARLIEMAGAGVCWLAVTPPAPPVKPSVFVLLRLIRESINALLPVAQVGGDVIGARLMTFYGPPGGVAAASVIVDIFVQTVTQFVFALTGFAILVAAAGDSLLIRWTGIGLIVAAVLVAAFFVVQRAGTFRFVQKMLSKLVDETQWRGIGRIGDLDDRLREIYRNRPAVIRALVIHMAIWIFGSCEVWIALWFMGHPVSIPAAIAIEALGQAVKGAAFAVPGAYGIQEGGYVALCAAFGVPAQPALALSLVKRVPDFVMGIPGLIAWQALEGRRLMKPSGRPG